MILSTTFQKSSGILSVKLTGAVSRDYAVEIHEYVKDKMSTYSPRMIYLDMKAVRFIDSEGIGCIIAISRDAKDLSCELALNNIPDVVKTMIKISGLSNMSDIRICV